MVIELEEAPVSTDFLAVTGCLRRQSNSPLGQTLRRDPDKSRDTRDGAAAAIFTQPRLR